MSSSETDAAALKRRIRTIDRQLDKVHGPRTTPERRDPLAMLVGTILSQNTSDVNSHRAYEALRAAFPTWEGVATAPRAKIERVLRPGGLAKTKSARIQRILKSIAARGTLSLDHLDSLSDAEAEQELLAYEGVGYKTARCVLLFALGRDSFPIDTHVHRILTRVGVVPDGMSADRAHVFVPPFIPKGRCYALHVNLMAHGRATCRPRTPACTECCIRRHCDFADAQHLR